MSCSMSAGLWAAIAMLARARAKTRILMKRLADMLRLGRLRMALVHIGHLPLDPARNQRQDGSQEDDHASYPHPLYERIDNHMDDGFSGIRVPSRHHHIEIARQVRAKGHVAQGLLFGDKEAPLRMHDGQRMAVFRHGKRDPFILVIRPLAGSEALAPEQIVLRPQNISRAHQALGFIPEGLPGEPDENQNNAEMDDVAAVAPGVPHGEVVNGGEEVFLARLHARTRALIELSDYAGGNESAQEQRHPGVKMAHAGEKQNDTNDAGEDQRGHEIPLDALERSF